MHRRSLSFCFSAGLFAACIAVAQTSTDSPAQHPTGEQQEHLSPSVSQAIREKLPTYVASEEKPADPSTAHSSNAVVLEKMIIRGPKTRIFTERELATKARSESLLRKRYPGAVPPNRHLLNFAQLMAEDDERAVYLAELDSVAEDLQAVGDVKASKDLRKEISRSFMRRTDWQTESLDRSANNNRR